MDPDGASAPVPPSGDGAGAPAPLGGNGAPAAAAVEDVGAQSPVLEAQVGVSGHDERTDAGAVPSLAQASGVAAAVDNHGSMPAQPSAGSTPSLDAPASATALTASAGVGVATSAESVPAGVGEGVSGGGVPDSDSDDDGGGLFGISDDDSDDAMGGGAAPPLAQPAATVSETVAPVERSAAEDRGLAISSAAASVAAVATVTTSVTTSAGPASTTTGTSTGAAPAPAPAPAPAKSMLPVLHGKLSWSNDLRCTFSGQWAMNPNDTITSYFEYTSRDPAEAVSTPAGGLYDGYFMLKRGPGVPETKFEEKGLTFAYTDVDGTVRVAGKGKNVFGEFKLVGTFNPTTFELQVTKEYPPKPLPKARTPARRGARAKRTPKPKTPTTTKRTPKPKPKPRPRPAATLTPAGVTPRAQRKRALPSYLRDQEPTTKAKTSFEIKSCQSLLKQLSDHKWAVPFLQPVDPVRLNIPDYFDIIKQPMDFATIRSHLGKGTYKGMHDFASDVRLVFQNAIMYNKPGSPVYQMADALAKQFERKFAETVSSVTAQKRADEAAARAAEERRKNAKARAQEGRTPGRGARGRGGRGRGRGRGRGGGMSTPAGNRKRAPPVRTPRSGGKAGKKPRTMSSARRKPRPAGAQVAAQDTSNSEVALLRAQLAVLQQQVVALQATSQPSFSVEEKRMLSEHINQLPGDKLDHVLDIIARRMPSLRNRAADEDVEIDFDSLDNGTLVELNDFVKSCLAPKPRAKSRKSKTPRRSTARHVEELDEQLRSLSTPYGADFGLHGDGYGDAGELFVSLFDVCAVSDVYLL